MQQNNIVFELHRKIFSKNTEENIAKYGNSILIRKNTLVAVMQMQKFVN